MFNLASFRFSNVLLFRFANQSSHSPRFLPTTPQICRTTLPHLWHQSHLNQQESLGRNAVSATSKTRSRSQNLSFLLLRFFLPLFVTFPSAYLHQPTTSLSQAFEESKIQASNSTVPKIRLTAHPPLFPSLPPLTQRSTNFECMPRTRKPADEVHSIECACRGAPCPPPTSPEDQRRAPLAAPSIRRDWEQCHQRTVPQAAAGVLVSLRA